MFKPGVLRLNRWVPGYDPMKKVRISLVWIRVHTLPLGFQRPQNLFNIGIGLRLPIKIDPLLISLYLGIYARILVEVDLTMPLPDRILVTKTNQNNCDEFEFFVDIEFKSLQSFVKSLALLAIIWRSTEEERWEIIS